MAALSFTGLLLLIGVTVLCGVCIMAIRPKSGEDEHHHGHGHGHGHH